MAGNSISNLVLVCLPILVIQSLTALAKCIHYTIEQPEMFTISEFTMPLDMLLSLLIMPPSCFYVRSSEYCDGLFLSLLLL
jgi:hypothetical protein